MFRFSALLVTGSLLVFACGVAPAQTKPGKFFIVGMGTAADLITVRAQRAIAQADIVVAEEGALGSYWAEHARGKQVWEYPHDLRRFYGVDPARLADPAQRARAAGIDKSRRQLVARIAAAVKAGKVVANLQGGDPMMFGMTLFLEMLPADVPSEIVPGVGAFQAASAALKSSPPYGYDTSAVILTMTDWPGRSDVNQKLMATGSTLVFYTMGLDYPALFAQLQRAYPPDTPVAVVNNAGDPAGQAVVRSTVGRFLQDVDRSKLAADRHMLFVGKFLTVGQARKDKLVPRP